MHRDIIIFINVMCVEHCTFFKSFVSDRSQEIFILISPIISEGTKDQRTPKRRPLTWVEIPRESLQGLQGHLGKIILLSWDFWSLENLTDILHQTLVFVVSWPQTICNTKTQYSPEAPGTAEKAHLRGTSALACTSSVTQISDLRSNHRSHPLAFLEPRQPMPPSVFASSQGQKDSEPWSKYVN